MLMWLAFVVLSFAIGVCVGASAVEVVDDEPCLPSGWWLLPGAIMGGLVWAALLVWMNA